MPSETVVLITGVTRGIGRTLAEAYLLRPNHVVVGSVRDRNAAKNQELTKLPTGEGSRLVLVSIEATSLADPKTAIQQAEEAGISHIDVVIINAGLSPTPVPPESVNIQEVIDCFQVNCVSPILLYQAAKHLLDKSSSPKWLTISSAAGSIERLEVHKASFVCAYGVSKAAVDWFTLAVHASNPNWVAFAIHPGLVQTEMGNMGARMMGMEIAPNTLEECQTKTMSYLDNATREKTSGKFINVIDGEEIPW